MGKLQEGSLVMPNTFKKSSPAPLDDRVAVLYKTDLITNSVWIVNGLDTRYTGMVVFVLRDDYTDPSYENVTDGNHTYDNWPNIPIYPSLIPLLPTGQHLYTLIDGDNPNNIESWELVGGSGGGANNTAGNTEVDFAEEEEVKKLFLIGAKTKGQHAGSYAVTYVGKQRTNNNNNDNNGSYVGDTYVDEHGWLHTANEPVAVKKDLDPIMTALQSMETWPSIGTREGICQNPRSFNITTNNIPDSKYLVEGANTRQQDLTNGGVYDIDDIITIKQHIQINPEAQFLCGNDPCRSELDAEFIFENTIYGMTYGYKETLNGNKHTGPGTDILQETLTLRPQSVGIRNFNSNIETTFALYFNEELEPVIEVNCDSQRPAGIEAPMLVLPAGERVGRIMEGANYIDLKFTNPSEMTVVGNNGMVPGIDAFYLSNIANANNEHHAVIQNQQVSIQSQDHIFATNSVEGVKTKRPYTVYGVHRIYSNGSVLSDNLPENPNDDQHEFSTYNINIHASTGAVNSYDISYLWNYYTNREKVIYIKFGAIDPNHNDARIFIPIIQNQSLRATAISEYNAQTCDFDNTNGVELKLLQDPVIIDNIEYNVYAVLSKGDYYEGPNGYMITLEN